MSPTSHSEKKTRSGRRRRLLGFSFAAGVGTLSLLFILQAILLFNGSWEIPDRAVAKLQEKLKEQGLRFDYRDLHFRFPGRVIVTDPQLARIEDQESFASAEAGQVSISLLKLLQGEDWIRKITLYGGAVFCPGSLSPTGAREQVLEQAHLVLTRKDEEWTIQNLNGQLENLRFIASGTFPSFPERPEEPPLEWEALAVEILPRLIREREAFQRVVNPVLRVRFSPTAQGDLAVEARAWAAEVQGPEKIHLVEPYLATRWNYDGSQWRGIEASFGVARAEWDSEVSARSLTGQLIWPSTGNGSDFLPNRAELSLTEIRTAGGSFTDLQVDLAARTPTQVGGRFFAFFQDDPLTGEGTLNWRTGTGELDITSRINPTPILQHEIVRELGLERDIFFQEPLFARIKASMKEWDFVRASAHAKAREADIDGVFMNWASARVELLPDRFLVPELILVYEDFEAVGSYEVDFATQAFRFLFKGEVRPLHISAWFRDWWVHLWEEFEFPEGPLRGDVDIQSVLGESEQVRLVGSLRAKDFFLRGAPFQTMDTKLFVLDKYVDLFDTRITRMEGAATGSFQYWANPVTNDFAKLVFEVDSTVNPADLAQVFGEAGQGILSPFRFTQAPSIHLADTVHGPPRERETHVALKGSSAAPLEFHGIALDHLTVEGTIEGDAWTLPKLHAGLAGGEIEGSVKKGEGEKEQLDFALLLRDLNLKGTLAALSQWQTEKGIENDEISEVRNISGIFDMNLEASGIYGDLQSFTGDGSVKIREADLAEIHLLGVLSRVLRATPLGFTSLQFDEAEARFQLDGDILHVPDLQLTGPTSAISGSGDYRIDPKELDFSIKLHFLKESRIPFLALLLSPVFEPLAHVMEIRLSGTAADPEWRFLLGPRNILSGISSSSLKDEPPSKDPGKKAEE